ncbi:MAG: C4-dicarboxylate ABC transporter [Desulfobacteraceae bacterium IS3]|jgi:tripartite ATP-independent transporter DctM subunit|nr:MAG: C4-dicarboxylate ABC transporter [Desulfobacteraceae bacterium IS3]HAO20239.1 C4-dicarboxylate ABC transporter [Desulfobacteraceae bacterium]
MIMFLIILIVLLALLGMPLFAVIGGVTLLAFYAEGVDLSAIAIEIYRIADAPILMALPLFTFAGYMLSESNTSRRLVRLTQAFLGWVPGGLSIVAFVACSFFTAFTGGSGVTIVALGPLIYPALRQAGYSEKFGLGLITTSGSLGILIAPSLPLILYGIIAQQLKMKNIPAVGIDDLFLAGILPALLMIVMLSIYSLWVNRHSQSITLSPFSIKEVMAAIREVIWEIPLPFFVIGGIYSGFFAVSEAAAATAMYVIVAEVFIYKEIKLSQVPDIMRDSMIMVGGILLILSMGMAFTNYMIDAEVPMKMLKVIQSFVTDKYMFLILLNLFLLMLSSFLDVFTALVIMVPLLLPVAVSYGIHPVHFGIIFLANMEIGYCIPPISLNLFIASYRFNKTMSELFYASFPFLIVLLSAVMVITFVPELTLMLIRH